MQLGLRPRGILSLLGTLYPIEHSRSLSNPYLKQICCAYFELQFVKPCSFEQGGARFNEFAG